MRKARRTALELTGLSATMGLGAGVVEAINPAYGGAFSVAAPMLPAVGSAAMGGIVLGQLGKMARRRK